MISEAEAIQALDQANFLRTVGGNALALVGTILFFWLVMKRKPREVSKATLLVAVVLTIGGLLLAQGHVYT